MKSRLITPIRLLAALILLVLFTLSILVYRDFTIEQDPEESEDYRMPLTNPPLEPDRPDLIGEPRPFGLSLIESMACGTPVIAFNLGSMPEIIRDGETGYIVEDIEGAINAVETIHNAGATKFNGQYILLFRSHLRNGRSIISIARTISGCSDFPSSNFRDT
jgi:hypothetical protein